MAERIRLVADRFLMRDERRGVDLATGEAVILRIAPGRDARVGTAWAVWCGWLVNASHPSLCPLVDYGACGPRHVFEAWRSDGVWMGDATAAHVGVKAAAAHLQACGVAIAAGDRDLHAVNGRPVLLPAAPGDEAASVGMLDTVGSVNDPAACGLWLEPPPAALAVGEALTEAGTTAPRVFSAWADDAEDAAWTQRSLARTARRLGIVPVAVGLLAEARPHVSGRSLCVLSRATAAESWRAWLMAATWSLKPAMLICVDPDPPGAVVRLPAPWRSFDELMAAVRPRALAGEALAVVRRAARQAQGSPGRFRRALSAAGRPSTTFALASGGRAAVRVSEPSAPYARGADDSTREPGVERWPASGELVMLRSRMRRAVEQIDRGRHVTGSRALRQAVGALSRRRDHSHVAQGMLDLARLHLRRGHLKEAKGVLAEARDAAANLTRPDLLTQVAVLSGRVALNELRLDEAEALLRTAKTAAEGLAETEPARAAAHGLARCLFWRGRYDEAGQLLSPLADGCDDARVRIRLAVAQSSLAVGAGDFTAAVTAADGALTRAREAAPELVASAATALAFCHLAVGDVRAVRDDVRVAVAAARRTHRPLCIVRARLIAAEAERRAGRPRIAAVLTGRVGRVRRLPPLLRAQATLLADLVRGRDERAVVTRHIALTGLEALALYAPATAPALPVRHVVGLLECCQTADEESTLLGSLCERLRSMLDAAATAFVVEGASGPAVVASSGARVGLEIAARVAALESAILPHAGREAVEGGVPVRYGGLFAGVLVARWPLGARPPGRACDALMMTAATAAAPALAAVTARQRQASGRSVGSDLLGVSAAIEAIRQAVARAAPAPFPVLIEGETGCGKELVARAIHRQSPRRDRPLCTVNCAALPDDLVDSELFGHARGAFTGALAERVGVFEASHQGTLFLDEIGELSLRAQAKVLRTVQEGEVRRVGENVSRRVDTRLVAATNRDLRAEAAAGRFRADLLYRLDVIRIAIPPLRERREDVRVLADAVWQRAAERVGSRARLASATLAQLARYDWPGNVRELQNVLAALAVRAPRAGVIGPTALPPSIVAPETRASRLDDAKREFEGQFVRNALARAGGHRRRAAEELGVTRQGLTKIIARHGLTDALAVRAGSRPAIESLD